MMSVVIEGYNKPKSCLSCPFNRDDCWCSITHGEIDRDYYDCDKPCPIKPLDDVLDKIESEIVTEGDRVVGEGEYFTGFHLGMICALKTINKYKKGESDG